MIQSFPTLFDDTPGQTNVFEHNIDVGDATPIRQWFYRVTAVKWECWDAKVGYMLENSEAFLFQLGHHRVWSSQSPIKCYVFVLTSAR